VQLESPVKVPEITQNLLRAKYKDLKRGLDNLDYIKETLEIERKKAETREFVKNKYDYKAKPIIPGDAQVGASDNRASRRQQRGRGHPQLHEHDRQATHDR
jgi:hypothetical protein